MAIAPALAIIFGLVTLLVLAGFWLMKPTVHKNPGVAAYQAPTAKMPEYGREAKSVAAELAAYGAANGENRKPGLLANAQSQQNAAERPSVAAAPKPATRTAQKRQDASPRFGQPEPAAQSAFAQWRFGMFR